jgi:hypothetical protein
MSLYEAINESCTAYSCLQSDVVHHPSRYKGCGMTSLPHFMTMWDISNMIGA